MGHDIVTQVIILLGQYLLDNADNLAGKAVAVAPVAGVVASGFVERAWAKVAMQAVSGMLSGFIRKPGNKDTEQKG